ncbi:hypothetical protein LZ32DRAFT_597926 [Colletotrichum eremochloae]|nr:hypothetical protein LZ32DRAFT_597926 [Colletotrichum eremochloae]
MDQNGPSTPRVITEQPVSRNEMIKGPGVQRRRGPAAHTDGTCRVAQVNRLSNDAAKGCYTFQSRTRCSFR